MNDFLIKVMYFEKSEQFKKIIEEENSIYVLKSITVRPG